MVVEVKPAHLMARRVDPIAPPDQRLPCKNSLTQDLEYFVNRSIVFEFPEAGLFFYTTLVSGTEKWW